MTVVDETPGEPTDARGRVAELHALREQARRGPSERATEAQHAKGKLTARERIELLLDEGSFNEVEQLRRHRATGFGLEAKKPYTDGVITGWGTVEGRTVFVYAHDFRIFGGALGEAHATKIHKIMDMAIAAGAPLVSLNDGAGARIQEGVSALAGYGGIFQRNTRASGVIPQISVMLGPCAGGAAYSPGADRLRLHGPRDLADVHHRPGRGPGGHRRGDHPERPRRRGRARRDLGRRALRVRRRGDLHRRGALPALDAARRTTGRTRRPRRAEDPADRRCDVAARPGPGRRQPPVRHAQGHRGDRRRRRVPGGPRALGPQHHLRAGPARRPGRRHRRQPAAVAWPACWTSRPREKAARFVQMCDAFNIPIVTLLDVPGFLPGVDQEHGGIIRHGAKLLYAYCNATVPRISLILRKAYGGAYIVMDSPVHRCRPDLRLADQRDRGDGRRGRGQRHLPPADRRRPTTPRPCGPAWSRSTRPS